MRMERHYAVVREINGWQMEIGEHGYVYADHDWWHWTAMCSPFSRLYLITGGEGWVQVGDRRIRLLPGNAYWIPAGLTFSYGCEEYVEKLYFHLRLIRSDGYDLADGLSFVAQCPLESELLADMLARYRGDCWQDVLTLRHEVERIALRLLAQYDVLQRPLPTYSSQVEQAMQFVRGHLSAHLTVGQVAQGLFASEVTLSRRFRQETGRTIHQYVEDMVFQAAQRQLVETTRPLGEISEELGFCDSFYFSRRFRQRYGEPPSAFRRRLRTTVAPPGNHP